MKSSPVKILRTDDLKFSWNNVANTDSAEESWMDLRRNLQAEHNKKLEHTKRILDLTKYSKIGVVGYSSAKFDEQKAKSILFAELSKMVDHFEESESYSSFCCLVSGLTDIGIPGIAYHLTETAVCIPTVGIACSKAEEYECYDVDEKHIIGNNWGDESEFFIDYIDAIIRVGGGPQSYKEVEMFKAKYPEKLVIEIELDKED